MPDLNGKVIAITGAARGMGRAFTHAFIEEGAKVVAMVKRLTWPSKSVNVWWLSNPKWPLSSVKTSLTPAFSPTPNLFILHQMS